MLDLNTILGTIDTQRHAPCFIDPPRADQLADLPELEAYTDLPALLDQFHRQHRTDWDNIDKRIAALSSIHAYAEERNATLVPLHHVSPLAQRTSRLLANVSRKATTKAGYLEALKLLYENKILNDGRAVYDETVVQDYFCRPPSDDLLYLTLSRTVRYDNHEPRFWGDYWLEIIDPCHRALEQYRHKWLRDGARVPSFLLWLEDNEVDVYTKRTTLLKAWDIEARRIHTDKGRIVTFGQDGSLIPLTTARHTEQLFTANSAGEILTCSSDKGIRHVSLSRGKPVAAAGVIEAENGVVTAIHVGSGHYLPPLAIARQTIDLFNRNGIHVCDRVKYVYYEHFCRRETDVSQVRARNIRAESAAPV